MMYVSRTLRMQTWFDNQSASEGKDDIGKPPGIIHVSQTVHGENTMLAGSTHGNEISVNYTLTEGRHPKFVPLAVQKRGSRRVRRAKVCRNHGRRTFVIRTDGAAHRKNHRQKQERKRSHD